MKKLLSIITIFISLISFSQKSEFSYLKGKISKNTDYTDMVFSESDNKGGFFVLKRSAGGVNLRNVEYILEHLDSKLKTIDSYVFEKKYYDYNNFRPIVGMFTHEDKIILIENSFKDKTWICNALISNQSKLVFNEKKELYSDKEDNYYGSNYIINKNNTGFALIFSQYQKNIIDNKIFIYDKNLNKKSDITYTKDKKKYWYEVTNIQLSNDSKNIFITENLIDSKKDFYVITKLNQESQKNIVFENNSENKILGIEPYLNNEDVHIFSYYGKNDNAIKGIAYQKIDINNFTANKFIFNEFTEQFFLDKYGGDTKKPKEVIKAQKIAFRNIFLNENNEFIITTEESDGYNYPLRLNDLHDLEINKFIDFHIIKINTEGKLVWSRLVNKIHVCNGDYSYVSLFTFTKNNYNYIIFNSGKTIIEDKKAPYFRQVFGYNQDLIALKVDTNGNYTYETIFDHTKNEVLCEIKDAKLFNNDFIFLGSKKNENQFYKYTIK